MANSAGSGMKGLLAGAASDRPVPNTNQRDIISVESMGRPRFLAVP